MSEVERGTRVFLSYSRKDAAFIRRLADLLEARGYAAIYDKADKAHHDEPDLALSAQDEWWMALKRMIAASDVMVFVVSPDSATSRVCDDEIAHARLLGRRIIAVLRRWIDFDAAPERLRALNVKLDFTSDEQAAQDVALAELVEEIDRDIDWLRQGARLVRQAQHWSANDKPRGDLLRAGAIVDAERWLTRRPANAPAPGKLVLDYLETSRALEVADRNTLLHRVANGFAVRADKAMSEQRIEHAAKCVGAAGILAEDVDFTPQRAEHAWRLGARAVLATNHVVMRGHSDAILDAQWSVDGRLIATASRDGTCRLWDAEDGRETYVLETHAAVRACIFLPDGQSLATAGDDGFVRIWDIGTGLCTRQWRNHSERLKVIACAPDGAWIASGGRDMTIMVVDAASGERRAVLEGHKGEIVSLRVSRDSRRLASAAQDGRARTWDLVAGRALAIADFASEITSDGFIGTSVEFSPDGDWVLSGGPTGEVAIWSAATGEPRNLKRCHDDAAFGAAFSPNGQRFATAGAFDRLTRIWDVRTFDLVAELAGHEAGLWSAVFSPDGSRVATIDCDGEARLWDAQSGSQLQRFAAHEKFLNTAAFSADGRRLLTAGGDGRATIWDATASTLRLAIAVEDAALKDARVATPQERLITLGKDKLVRVWTPDGTEVAAIGSGETHARICTLSEDGARVVVANAGEAPRLIRAENGDEERAFDRVADWKGTATFSPCHRWVAIGHEQGLVCFETAMGATVFEAAPAGATHAAFAGDGGAFVAGDEAGVVALAVFDGVWRTLETSGHDSGVTGVDVSPSKTFAATCGWDGAVRIWRLASGEEAAALAIAPSDRSVDAALFLDDRHVIATTRDGRMRVLDWPTGEEVAALQGVSGPQSYALSPDRKMLAAANWKGIVQVWDIATRTELVRVEAAFSSVIDCRFVAAGEQLLMLTDATSLWVLDLKRELAALTAAGEHRGVLAAAALACGVGVLGEAESEDFLFAGAPRALGAGLLERLDSAHAERVAATSAALRSSRSAECYFAPNAAKRVIRHGRQIERESSADSQQKSCATGKPAGRT